MAFIYMAGGWALNAHQESRESLNGRIKEGGGSLEVMILFDSGGARQPDAVTVAAHQIAVISDQPLAQR
jgi:hypothetical protein